MNFPRWKMFTEVERGLILGALSRYGAPGGLKSIAEGLIAEINAVDQQHAPTVAEAKAAGQLPGVVGYVAGLPQTPEGECKCGHREYAHMRTSGEMGGCSAMVPWKDTRRACFCTQYEPRRP